MFEYLYIEFLRAEPATAKTIERVFDVALDAGCHTGKDAGNDQCRYSSPITDNQSQDGDTQTAIAEIASSHRGGMVLHYGDYDDQFSPLSFWVRVYKEAGETSPTGGIPRVLISVEPVYLDSMRTKAENVEARSNDLVTLAKTLYPVLQPVHVVGRRKWDITPGLETPLGPLEVEEVTIDNPVDWMAVFTPETIERIGTDWLDEVDLYRHEQLDDGSLLVVLTPRPDMPSELAEKHDELAAHLDFSK